MNRIDFRNYDWDDTALIAAYDKIYGPEGTKKKNDNKNGSKNKENKRRKWNVGDNCRALFSEDNLYYEAKIISMNGDFCTVEFLGYEDTEDVDLLQLKESEGKKARRKQIKECAADSADQNSSNYESETAGETTDGTAKSRNLYRKKKSQVKQSINNTTYDTTMYETTYQQQYPASAAPVPYYALPMPTNQPFMPTSVYPNIPSLPQLSVPPAPPIPQCSALGNNPAFASMLTSWYLAGYYTGINSVQKENRGCQHSCNHSNQHCHNY